MFKVFVCRVEDYRVIYFLKYDNGCVCLVFIYVVILLNGYIFFKIFVSMCCL